MLVTLTHLRHRGRRLSDRDIANATRFRGVVQMRHADYLRMGRVDVLELRKPDSVLADGVIACLYEPRLVEWREHLMLIRGFELAGDTDQRFGAVQEWRLEMP